MSAQYSIVQPLCVRCVMGRMIDSVVEALEDSAKVGVTVCLGILIMRIIGQFMWGW